MKIEVTKQTRFILAGALVGSLIGALGGMFFFQQKNQAAKGEGSRLAAIQSLPTQRVAALLWHTINVIREIVSFGSEE